MHGSPLDRLETASIEDMDGQWNQKCQSTQGEQRIEKGQDVLLLNAKYAASVSANG